MTDKTGGPAGGMTDRELLEMAARAARLDVISWYQYGESFGLLANIDHCVRVWNPLSNDDDAFRLLVKLGLDLLRTAIDVEAIAGLVPQTELAAPFGIETIGNDPYAATRRAIVRAATEIGKEMK